MNNNPKVLLTTSYGPYDPELGEDMYDAFAERLSRGQGLFSMSSHFHCWALHLIAENLSLPTTVLEDPHWEDFEREVENGYDFIGFQLKSIDMDKVADMVRLVRRKSPRSKVILGGYGVGTLHDPVPGDTRGSARFLLDNADWLCREEGVRFMRRITADEPEDRPITQYHLPCGGFSFRALRRRRLRVPIVLVALGCPNACEFCATSAFFHHKKTYVADPEQTYRFMKNHAYRLRSKSIFTFLFDEDIFQNAAFVRELGRLIRSDRKTWGFKWFGFGSVSALSQYTPEELRDSGVLLVWVGVESTLCDDPGRAGKDFLPKRQGDVASTFKGLQNNGILVVGSTVMGFDFHTPENIQQDIDYFVNLKPSFYQIAPLTPCPGTELYRRMKEEGRLYQDYGWKEIHLWKGDVYKLKNFGRNEIARYIELAHTRIVEENGPSVLSVVETCLDGYESLRGCHDDFHRQLRRFYRRLASMLRGTLLPVIEFGPSPVAKARAVALDRRVLETMGLAALPSGWLVGKLAVWSYNRATSQADSGTVLDPPAKWTYYNLKPPRDTVYVRKGRGHPRIRPRPKRVLLFG